MHKFYIILLSLIFVVIVGCAGGDGDPAGTVETYLQAKVDSDSDTIQTLLCSEMEQHLERETQTFRGIEGTRIDGMACEQTDDNRVQCEGRIVALYGTEENEFPLTAYHVVQEDGEWKWCGETE